MAKEPHNLWEECSTLQVGSQTHTDQVGAIKTAHRDALFRPMQASSVQCRKWSRQAAEQIKSECKLSQVGAIKTADRAASIN